MVRTWHCVHCHLLILNHNMIVYRSIFLRLAEGHPSVESRSNDSFISMHSVTHRTWASVYQHDIMCVCVVLCRLVGLVRRQQMQVKADQDGIRHQQALQQRPLVLASHPASSLVSNNRGACM